MSPEDSTPLLVATSELRRLNWALSAFARSSAALIRFTSFESLIPRICEAVVGDNDYLLAMVGLAETGPTSPIRLLGVAGRAAAYVEGLNLSWSDAVAEGRGPSGQAIRSGRPLIIQDVETDGRFSHWVERARSFGIRSCVAVPFSSEDETPGILIVYSGKPAAFGEQEMEVFERLASELAFARSVEKARSDLFQSEARFRMLAENATDVILQIDLEGHIAYASPSIRHFGYRPEDVVGGAANDFVHPEDRKHVSFRRQEVGQGKQSGSFEIRYRRADGGWSWIESNPAPMQLQDGRIDGVITVMRDITQRKKAEDALKESEARYRLLAENSTDLVRIYDLEGRISYASPSIRRYGYQPADLVGRQLGGGTRPDDLPRVLRAFHDASGGALSPLEAFQARSKDGRWFWFEGQMSPLKDDADHVVGVLAVTRDVSARLAAEEALGEVNAELTRVTRISILGAFSASIGHELNQPLTALVANNETALRWLSKDPPNLPMAESAIMRSVQNALRASETIAGIRSMVTKGTSTVAEFDVNDAIREVLALTLTERHRTKVTAKADVTLHPLMIHGDRIQVQQVLLNLIGNAIEAMGDAPEEERQLFIRAGAIEDGQVLVEIEDRGAGLDQQTADHIFDHLFTTKTGGTGLGLSISKSIIESHGGRIWAESVSPNGAVFRFQLPQSTPLSIEGPALRY